jgi:ATP-binding cassette, subfamily B, multidrug efflux pump
LSKVINDNTGGGFRSTMTPPRAGVPSKIEKAKDPRNAFIRLLFYLKPFKKLLIIIFSLVLLYTLLGLAGPYLIGVAIDKFIYLKDIEGLGYIAVLMFAIYLLNNLFQVIANWIMSKVSQDALKQMRGDLFKHLQELSLSFFDRNPAGELMSRLTNDIDAINQAVSQNVTSLVASMLTMAGIIAAMFVLNSWLALVTIIVVPLIFWFTRFVARYTRKGFRELQKGLGHLNGTMEETISGQKVVKSFRRKDSAIENFRLNNNLVYKAGVYANTYALLLMPITNVLGNFFVIVIAGFGGWLALKGLVTVGVIATFINYGQNFIQPLRQLANMYNSIQAALAGAERVFEILDTDVEVKDLPEIQTSGSIKGEVNFDNVEFGYTPNISIIKKMSLHAYPGEMIALVGPTGAGKTTIVNLLTRFYEINSGKISIDNRDIKSFKKADLRKQLGLVLQDTFLFSGTVMENIRYGRLEATDDEVMKAAAIADADQFIQHLPRGYQTELSERAGNLSQGQRQLLSIARAVLANPRILILDEATSSVDTRTEVRIQSALLRLMEGRTSFVIAHRLSTIRDANQVLVIDDGRVIEKGTFKELINKQGSFYNLYVSQFKGIAI